MYTNMQMVILMSVLVQTQIHLLYQIINYMNTFVENFVLQLKGITLFVSEK